MSLSSLTDAMTWLGQQPDTIFIGQSVGTDDGTKMTPTLAGVPKEKRLEFPVAEDLQLGLAIGLSLEGGCVPVLLYPRIDFLLCAASQLVLHLDKLPLYSDYRPKVIIRTAVGTKTPLDAGPQHTGDYVESLRLALRTVRIIHIWFDDDDEALMKYKEAYARNVPTILIDP
jgi:pyruvate/2-oxoglutarate/acetoin dehydrogenase E1 component